MCQDCGTQVDNLPTFGRYVRCKVGFYARLPDVKSEWSPCPRASQTCYFVLVDRICQNNKNQQPTTNNQQPPQQQQQQQRRIPTEFPLEHSTSAGCESFGAYAFLASDGGGSAVPNVNSCRIQPSNEKRAPGGCLGYLGDYTTQWCWDYNKPVWWNHITRNQSAQWNVIPVLNGALMLLLVVLPRKLTCRLENNGGKTTFPLNWHPFRGTC